MGMLALRRPVTETGFSPVYQAQKRDYSERYSIHEQNARRWRWTAFGAIGVAFVAVIGLVYDDSLSKFVPYVVERDQHGDEVAIGRADKAAEVDPRTIQAELRKWLLDIRTVSPDAETEKRNIYEAYAHTNKSSPANGELNEWFIKNNPFTRAANEIVTITITSMLPAEPHNWKLWRGDWREEVRSRSGDLKSSTLKEVSITVSHKPPKTDDDFAKNSSGTFVDDFDWKN